MKSLDNPDHLLIVYGTLVPGGLNHYLLADLPGTWEKCFIRGNLSESWGFKAFRYDADGPEHPAWLLTSPDLPAKLPELDDFEGALYRRRLIPARVGCRRLLANVYEGHESV